MEMVTLQMLMAAVLRVTAGKELKKKLGEKDLLFCHANRLALVELKFSVTILIRTIEVWVGIFLAAVYSYVWKFFPKFFSSLKNELMPCSFLKQTTWLLLYKSGVWNPEVQKMRH